MVSPTYASPAAPRRPRTLRAWVNALSLTLLVVAELVMLFVSLDWAIAGLFQLRDGITFALIAVSVATVAWVSWYLFRRALLTERQAMAEWESTAGPADA